MNETESEKEAHRLGTMGRWDAPDADWAAEYDWTRYRGPDAYPVPGDWVLDLVEADGIIWYRYPDAGEGHANDNDVLDSFESDYDGYNDARGETAMLGNDVVNEHVSMKDWELEQQLTVDGTTVFDRVEPETDELYANVAAALAAIDNGTDPSDVVVEWESGWERGAKPDESSEKNTSLGEF
ncbi:hypothetical protein [Haloarcula amylovorans]|uniref:hypothetical protein n=1 Tax=Haloarcula amylovorans TaxID=2562280 RepID=UPI001076BC4F|nr:hypothetical protein [Halomicroarcula amylolytica]